MQNRLRSFLFTLTAVIVILASAVGPSYVYADDGAPPAPSAEETTSGEVTGETPPEVSGDEGTLVGEQPPAEELVAPAEEQPPAEELVAPAEEQPPAEEPIASVEEQQSAEEPATPAEEPVTAAEILEQVPDGTELVVVNEGGEVEPLATETAAEIIVTGDPMWCPASVPPGGAGCTSSYPDFASLIAALAADAASPTPQYTGNGTIWVEDSYNGNDNAQIAFDGLVLTNINGSSLTIQGGWSGTLGDMTITGTSLADVSMIFVNWTGNIAINDFDIQAADGVGFGLWIENTGTTTLDNVSVNGTIGGPAGNNDGAVIRSTGNVDITDSEFNANNGNGLQAESGGNIALTNVSASNNTLAGAYLDTCLYNGAACQGTGNVTVAGAANPFIGNGFDGLVIASGGSATLQHVDANNNGLNGAYITNGVAGGAGNVQISDSNFLNNANATGLEVYQYSNGPIALNNVTANGNNMGAILDTTESTTADVNVNNSQFLNNDYTGLHVESGANVSLASVWANNNGANGGYMIADGNITVTNSQFNDNVHFNFPNDPGLFAQARGAITLTNVLANSNDFGAGAVLLSNNVGDITVNGSQFDQNGTFGVQAKNENGSIILTNVVANQNGEKGAYLNAAGTGTITVNGGTFNENGNYGIYAHSNDGGITVTGSAQASYNGLKGAYLTSSGGNIFVGNSTFVENGAYGIYVQTSNGDINLDTVTVTGDDGVAPNDDLTNIGAFLASGSGNIFVDNSVFELNTETGLIIVTDGLINLLDVIADQNGDNGAEFYSNYTWGCLCPGDLPSSTIVSIDGGTFTNNGGYGLLARPGPAGDLVFVDPPTTASTLFGGNGLGDFLLDTAFTPQNCGPCECGECCAPNNPPESKDPIIVPIDDVVEPVLQDCANTSGTVWQTPGGVWVKVGCPFKGYSLVQSLPQDGLPGPLGAGTNFEAGVTISLTDENENIVIVNPDGSITLRFTLPTSGRGRRYSILFWDTTLNEGAGGWVQLPPFEAGTSFPLHPEDPDDPRLIIAGVREENGALTATVNFPGIFVLVSR